MLGRTFCGARAAQCSWRARTRTSCRVAVLSGRRQHSAQAASLHVTHGVHETQAGDERELGAAREMEYLQKILTSRVYDVCRETPLQLANGMSKGLGASVYLKREDLQPIFSFKLRGAYNKIAHLTAEEQARGIVCCSAGNHAQGVAMAAAKLDIDAVIVMPEATPLIKVSGVRRHGGRVKVLLYGESYDEAAGEAQRLQRDEGRVMIHPYDDEHVIAGQGTIALEILKQLPPGQVPDAIFVCVGGGGMISGIALAMKQLYPQVKIIGVEANDAAGMTVSLRAGRRVRLDTVGLFADGAAVKLVGEETFRICRALVDEMVTVSTDDICAAIRDTFNDTRTIMEPAGALSVAGLTAYAQKTGLHKDGLYVAITSGANMNFDRLRFVSERAVPDEALVSVKIPERPGSFLQLYNTVGRRNITEFSYRYNHDDAASILMSFKSAGPEDVQEVLAAMRAHGWPALDMTGNELAKLHGRYLAGGRSATVRDEVLYRFEFPEVPGALGRFLGKLQQRGGGGWNVSLWHYRNYGADVGHILVGLQVHPSERGQLDRFLQELGYRCVNESENPVYKEFLA